MHVREAQFLSINPIAHLFWSNNEKKDTVWCPFSLVEGVKRKLNVASPTLDNLELVEFNPPDIKLLDKLEFGEHYNIITPHP